MRFIFALMLTLAFLPGCLSAPARNASDTRAGESKVRMSEHNERGTIVLPASQTITFNGNVGNVTLVDQSGDITGDQGGGLTNQGSTEATQSTAAEVAAAVEAALQADLQLTK